MLILSSLPSDVEKKLKALKMQKNIVGLSGGKDSVATCILLHKLDIPFQCVTAEVWWKKAITGENPIHYDFMHEKLFPKLNSWGIECCTVSSEKTAFEYITTPVKPSKKHPERAGKLRGFPICGRCSIQRDCKCGPAAKFYKKQNCAYNVITGIAKDEFGRLDSNEANGRLSLLEVLEICEWETFRIDKSEGLLSPVYNFSDRGGCWFCPNQKIQELDWLYRNRRDLWDELMYVQKMPNKVTEKFNRTQTLYDIEKILKSGVQQKLFLGQLL